MALFQQPKNTLLYFSFFLSLILLLCASCSNSFLDEVKQQNYYLSTDTISATSNSGTIVVDVSLNNAENKLWRIVKLPRWIDINPKNGEGNNIRFNITIHKEKFQNNFGVSTTPIVFNIDGEELESKIFKYYNFGDPEINVTPNSLSLKDESIGELNIVNDGYGLLYWEIANAPEWITFDRGNGTVDEYEEGVLIYSVNAADLDPGEYKDQIIIVNSTGVDLTIPVTLDKSEVTFNGTYYKDELVSTVYLKKTDQLIALTKNPNRLLYFNDAISAPKIVELNRVPKCMSLSENEDNLVIGFTNAEISFFTPTTREVIETIKLDAVPISIAFGNNSYLYYMAEVDQDVRLRSLNLNSKEMKVSEYDERGVKEIYSIPHKNMIVMNKPGYSPDMLLFYSMGTGGEINLRNRYHTDTNGYWLSFNKDRIYTATRVIYKVPDFDPDLSYSVDDPDADGEFEIGTFDYVSCVVDDEVAKRFYVAAHSYSNAPSKLFVYKQNTLVLEKTIEMNPIAPDDFHYGTTWYSKTKSLYVSKDGSTVWSVQQYPGYDYYDPELWAVRTILVDDE